MKWTSETPAPPARHVLSAGPLTLSVTPGVEPDNRCWQFVILSLGRHTDRATAECIAEWPRAAIALVRAALDEFEAKLNEENER